MFSSTAKVRSTTKYAFHERYLCSILLFESASLALSRDILPTKDWSEACRLAHKKDNRISFFCLKDWKGSSEFITRILCSERLSCILVFFGAKRRKGAKSSLRIHIEKTTKPLSRCGLIAEFGICNLFVHNNSNPGTPLNSLSHWI